MTLTGAKEAVVADFLKAFGQDVLQETTDELLGGEGAAFPMAGGPVAIAEGDLTVLKFKDAAVGKGNPEDIGGQILEGGLTRANRLAVNDPLLPPDLGGNLLDQPGLGQGGAELAPKQAGQGLDMNEEGIASAQPSLTIAGQTASGDEVMNMGMITQVAGPGLQHPQETDLPADKARIGGQSLQSGR